MLTAKVHRTVDFAVAALLIAGPWLFGFADIAAARGLFIALGVALLAYSLFTRARERRRLHLALDVVVGLLLMLGPALLDYRGAVSGAQYALHFILGLGMIALVAFSEPRGARPDQDEDAHADSPRTSGTVIDLNQGQATDFRRAA